MVTTLVTNLSLSEERHSYFFNLKNMFLKFTLFSCSYSVDVALDKKAVNRDAFRDPALRRKARRDIKGKFEDRWVLNNCFVLSEWCNQLVIHTE